MDTQLDQVKVTCTGHSSNVRMHLHINGVTIPVLQASKTAIKVNDASCVPRGDAVLEIIVDNQSDRWPILVLKETSRRNWISIADR